MNFNINQKHLDSDQQERKEVLFIRNGGIIQIKKIQINYHLQEGLIVSEDKNQ